MFDKKRTLVLKSSGASKKLKKPESNNAFVRNALDRANTTESGNGAKKLISTGSPFVDQFSKSSEYLKPRSYEEVARDMETLWDVNPYLTVQFSLYLRTIARKVVYEGKVTEDSQKGAELRSEAIMRFIWIAVNYPSTFIKNIQLFIYSGSWKDVIEMMTLDLEYNGWKERKLPWAFLYKLIRSGLADESQSELVKKYLPQIKATSKATTQRSKARNMIGAWLAHNLFIEQEKNKRFALYRNLKSSGNAHGWQKLISQEKFSLIDFNTIHGKALSKLVKSKFLKNHDLSNAYNDWIKKSEVKEKGVKATGFVHEILEPLQDKSPTFLPENVELTIIEQFNTLVNKAKGNKENKTKFIPVLDTSSSMRSKIVGQTKYSSQHVARSIVLFLSKLLEGPFKDCYFEFCDRTKMKTFNSDSVVKRYYEFSESYGSTNFQAIIDEICFIKTNTDTPESEFPNGIICISDNEFDNSGSLNEINVSVARRKLSDAGFSKRYADQFVIALWDIRNTYYSRLSTAKFETKSDVPNTFYFGGYAPSVISFLTNNKVETPEELFIKAMDQEILNLIKL